MYCTCSIVTFLSMFTPTVQCTCSMYVRQKWDNVYILNGFTLLAQTFVLEALSTSFVFILNCHFCISLWYKHSHGIRAQAYTVHRFIEDLVYVHCYQSMQIFDLKSPIAKIKLHQIRALCSILLSTCTSIKNNHYTCIYQCQKTGPMSIQKFFNSLIWWVYEFSQPISKWLVFIDCNVKEHLWALLESDQ